MRLSESDVGANKRQMPVKLQSHDHMSEREFSKTTDSASEPELGTESSARNAEGGFTLVEVVIAFVIVTVALLGVFATFVYAINYNAGNNSRAQALSVLQQEVEQIRSLKFTPYTTDAGLAGGTKAPKTVVSADGSVFKVQIVVDNNPLVTGVQDESVATSIKEVTVTVTLAAPTPGWQTAVPTTVVLRRTRGN